MKTRAYTLEEAVQLYCAMQGNDGMKGFKGYMVSAKLVWWEIFSKTLWNYVSEWLPVQGGDIYPYIMLPEDISLFMGIYDEVQLVDKLKAQVPLDFDNRIAILPKKETKACHCNEDCGCGELCACANNLVREEIEVEIDGEIYIENRWQEVCKNGDIIEWREVPSKVYAKDGSGDYVVEIVTIQNYLCTLKTKPCGCIEESEYNQNLFKTYCGIDSKIRNYMFERCCYVAWEKTVLRRAENNPLKIYIIGTFKDQYLLKSQRLNASDKSLVPEYALKALWFGIEHYSSMFNPSVQDKITPRFNYEYEKKEVIKYLNPITQRTLDYMQTTTKQM